MKTLKYLIPLFFIVYVSKAQNELSEESHKVLGAEVPGHKVNIPFSKAMVTTVWNDYATGLGKSEMTANHLAYQAIFKADIYPKEVLVFVEINGNTTSSSMWAGIDPQGVPKDTLKTLQKELKEYVYNFNVKVRTTAAQGKINESEQAASYLSKEFESLKRDERKNERNLERTSEKIIRYESELVDLRTDSSNYVKNLSSLSIKLDSLNVELEKVKGMVELYKQQLEAIE